MKYKKYMLMRDPGTKNEPADQVPGTDGSVAEVPTSPGPVEESGNEVSNDAVAD